MATKRMISVSISYSPQVNRLSEFAQLLFTWSIPHTDDFGKIHGDTEVLKAIVMPMSKRSVQDFEAAILEMINENLISRYEVVGVKVIEFLGFERHQGGLNKRTKSKFPENPRKSEKIQENIRNTSRSEQNEEEQNLIKAKGTVATDFAIKIKSSTLNPKNFAPSNAVETAALEVWKKLEPFNPMAFQTTYYWAYKKGLPENLFYQFVSEINQDASIKNKGAIFNKKVKEYFEKQQKEK